jgi:hypothetical protein
MSHATAALRADVEPAAELLEVIPLTDLNERTKKVRSGSGRRQRKTGVFVRLLPDEFSRLNAEAADAGLSVASYLRAGRIGTDAAPPPARRRPNLPAIEAQALARNNAELNMIGSNLNQAARALNEIALEDGNGQLAQVAHLTEPIHAVLEDLRQTLAANRRALGHDREG